MIKKFYEVDEFMAFLDAAEEIGLPYKVVKTVEPRYVELTDVTEAVTVWLFKFL